MNKMQCGPESKIRGRVNASVTAKWSTIAVREKGEEFNLNIHNKFLNWNNEVEEHKGEAYGKLAKFLMEMVLEVQGEVPKNTGSKLARKQKITRKQKHTVVLG